MPFTASHVVAVLPFLRTPLPASDLAGYRGVTSGGGAALTAATVYAIWWQLRRTARDATAPAPR